MTIQHVPVTGGCLCGAVRYESKEPPIRGYICHCTMCRRNYGSFFGATVRFPGSAFKLTKGERRHQIRQAMLLCRLRHAGCLFLRGESGCLDLCRISRPSRGLADDEGRIVGTIRTRVCR
jgi:hypothetical protein